MPGEEEEDELEQENEGDILNTVEQRTRVTGTTQSTFGLSSSTCPKKRRVSQAAGLFTVNEQQTRQICHFCPKSYSEGRNFKNTGTQSIVKHVKSAHADIPQVAATFDLVVEPKQLNATKLFKQPLHNILGIYR